MRDNGDWVKLGVAETAAGLAATLAADQRFQSWLGAGMDAREGWVGFIQRCLELAHDIEDRAAQGGGWENYDWYLTLDLIADLVLRTSPSDNLASQIQQLAFPRA